MAVANSSLAYKWPIQARICATASVLELTGQLLGSSIPSIRSDGRCHVDSGQRQMRGHFVWPQPGDAACELNEQQWQRLISGAESHRPAGFNVPHASMLN